MNHGALQNRVMLAVSPQCVLFSNATGAYRRGRHVISYGLCKGSADLIGWTYATIGGKRRAIFTAIELKRGPKDKPKTHQAKFLNAVQVAGGIAGVAWDIETAKEIIRKGIEDAERIAD